MNLRLSRHCALDVYSNLLQRTREIVLQFTSDGSNAGDGHLHHVHYIPVLLLPAASKVHRGRTLSFTLADCHLDLRPNCTCLALLSA